MTPELAGQANLLKVIDTLASRYLQGKIRVLRLAVIALLAEGHLLLEDIPGLGKTTLALALSRALGLSFGRIQCTSDLLPSDITGLSVYNREENNFRFIQGPVFNQLLLADEVNRAMPKTQSAMLEAMEEKRVTVEGKTYLLPEPFMVIATQNPTDQTGTYPLPESQLDRFLITSDIGYPPEELEKAIISKGGIRDQLDDIQPLITSEEILAARRAVREVHISDSLVDYIFRIAKGTRAHPYVLSGISTRGAIYMATAARAAAFLQRRDYVIPEDIKLVAVPVGAHRLILSPQHETLRKQEILQSVVENISVPML
ncbi:MAG: AAA family ATPase [Desulfuromonas sp.]|nr:MAG: AAA family ATPase [Desulfuromonas sp.]